MGTGGAVRAVPGSLAAGAGLPCTITHHAAAALLCCACPPVQLPGAFLVREVGLEPLGHVSPPPSYLLILAQPAERPACSGAGKQAGRRRPLPTAPDKTSLRAAASSLLHWCRLTLTSPPAPQGMGITRAGNCAHVDYCVTATSSAATGVTSGVRVLGTPSPPPPAAPPPPPAPPAPGLWTNPDIVSSLLPFTSVSISVSGAAAGAAAAAAETQLPGLPAPTPAQACGLTASPCLPPSPACRPTPQLGPSLVASQTPPSRSTSSGERTAWPRPFGRGREQVARLLVARCR